MSDFNYKKYLKNNPLLQKEAEENKLITEEKTTTKEKATTKEKTAQINYSSKP